MEAKYERSRTYLLKLIVIKSDNPDFEKFRQKLRDKLLQIRLESIEETFYPNRTIVLDQSHIGLIRPPRDVLAFGRLPGQQGRRWFRPAKV